MISFPGVMLKGLQIAVASPSAMFVMLFRICDISEHLTENDYIDILPQLKQGVLTGRLIRKLQGWRATLHFIGCLINEWISRRTLTYSPS